MFEDFFFELPVIDEADYLCLRTALEIFQRIDFPDFGYHQDNLKFEVDLDG